MAETASVRCPACERKLKVPTTAIGKKVRCPGCKEIVRLEASAEGVADTPPVPASQPAQVAANVAPKKEKPPTTKAAETKVESDGLSSSATSKPAETASPKVASAPAPASNPSKAQPKKSELGNSRPTSSPKTPAETTPVTAAQKVASKPVANSLGSEIQVPKGTKQKSTERGPSDSQSKASNFENKPQQISLPAIDSGSKLKSINPDKVSINSGYQKKRSPKVRPKRSNPWPSVMMAMFAMTVLVVTVVVINQFEQGRNDTSELVPELRVPERIEAVAGIPFTYFVNRSSLEDLPVKDRQAWTIEVGEIQEEESGNDVTSNFQFDNPTGQLSWLPPADSNGKTYLVEFLLKKDGKERLAVSKPLDVGEGIQGQLQLLKLCSQWKKDGVAVEVLNSGSDTTLPAVFHDVLVDEKRFRFFVFESSGDAVRADKQIPPLEENSAAVDSYDAALVNQHYSGKPEINAMILITEDPLLEETPAIRDSFGIEVSSKDDSKDSEMSDEELLESDLGGDS